MFVKWRTYQRQLGGVKGDKYIQQPIIVRSFRVGKKGLRKEFGKKKADLIYERVPEKAQRPRHEAILKLPSYPVCMVVYFRSPHWMSQRFQWWENVDMLLNRLLEVRDDVTPKIVKKLKDDIEKVVPRVTPDEVEKLKVVLNDLPLQL